MTNMTLEQKLRRLKKIEQESSAPDWAEYKEQWVDSIKELQNTIMLKWFKNYDRDKLMEFAIIPTKRIEPYIGEYLTTTLEITLSNSKTLLLEPISGVTTEYDGKLEFSMLGNAYKRVSILRELLDKKKSKWVVADSYNINEHYELTKDRLEKLIDIWLS